MFLVGQQGSNVGSRSKGRHLWGESHYGSPQCIRILSDWHIHATRLKIASPVGEKYSWFDKITHRQSY